MNCKEIFQDTLQELLATTNTTVKALSDGTKIYTSALYRFYNGESIPSVKNVIKLAEYFSCSLDYMFGLTDKYIVEQYRTVTTPNERFRTFLQESNLTRYQIYKATGIQENRLADWFHDRRIPSLSSLCAIAKAFSCSLDYLAGRDKI